MFIGALIFMVIIFGLAMAIEIALSPTIESNKDKVYEAFEPKCKN